MKAVWLLPAMLALSGCDFRMTEDSGLGACGGAIDVAVGLAACTKIIADEGRSPPEHTLALFHRGQYYVKRHRFEAAIDDLEAYRQRVGRREVPFLETLALSYRAVGRLDDALREFDAWNEVVEADPDASHGMAYYYLRSWTLADAGRYVDALEVSARGVTHQPGFFAIHMVRAQAFDGLGEEDAALEELLIAREKGGADALAEQGAPPRWLALLERYGVAL